MSKNYRIRFCENNKVTTTATVSSPVVGKNLFSNALDSMRSKVWRPTGYFRLGSSTKLYINDGSDKIATITGDDFRTPQELATAITTALNAVSTTWVCTYESDNRFQITRTAGTAILRLSQTTDSVWGTIGFATGTDRTTAPHKADFVRNHTNEFFEMDLGLPTAVGYFALIGPSDDLLKFSASANITIYASDVSHANPQYTKVLTPNASGIFAITDKDDGTLPTYRYWQFTYSDQANPLGPSGISIGHIYIGDFITLTSRNVGIGFTKQVIDLSTESVSDGGVIFFNEKQKYHSFKNLSMQFISATDRLALEQFFFRVGKTKPFYLSLDPLGGAQIAQEEYNKYVYFESTPVLTHIKHNYYSVSFSVREAL